MSEREDETITGNFIVRAGLDEKVIHDKADGKTKCEEEEEVQAVFRAIEDLLS